MHSKIFAQKFAKWLFFGLCVFLCSNVFAQTSGKIFFLADKLADVNDHPTLYSVDLDGNNLTDLGVETCALSGIFPAWDGNKLFVSYTSYSEDEDMFTFIDFNGNISNSSFSTNNEYGYIIDTQFSWIDNTDWFSFVRWSLAGYINISKARASDPNQEEVIVAFSPDFVPWNPQWSPDGTKLAFGYLTVPAERVEDDYSNFLNFSIAYLDANPNEYYDFTTYCPGVDQNLPLHNIAQIKVFYLTMPHFLQWSRDNSRLAFFSAGYLRSLAQGADAEILEQLDPPALYLYDLSQQELFSQPVEAEYIIDAVFSPNGKMMVYNVIGEIWLWDIENHELIKLVDTFENEDSSLGLAFAVPTYWGAVKCLAWSNNSENVIFQTTCQIFSVNISTKEVTRILHDPSLYISSIVYVNTNE